MAKLLGKLPTHLLVAIGAWGGRVVTAGVQLVSVRLLLKLLGVQDYAAFTVLISATAWFLMADSGAGIKLQNKISECRGLSQPWNAHLTLALLMIGISCSVWLALSYASASQVGSRLLSQFPWLHVQQKSWLFLVVAVTGVIQSLGSVQYRLWYAEHKGYFSSMLPAAASVTALVSLYAIDIFHVAQNERLLFCTLAYCGPQAAFPAIILALRICRARYTVRVLPEKSERLKFYRGSLGFWLFGIMAAGVLQVDYFVMSHYVNPLGITQYNLVTRVFSLVFFVYNAVVLALWPVCAEALAKKDYDKVKGYIKRYIPVGIAFVVICTILTYLASPTIIAILAPKTAISLPISLIVACGVYFCIRVWTDTYAMVLQSVSDLRPFWVFVPLQAFASVGFQMLLAPRFGAEGIVFGLILAFLLTVAWGLPLALSHKIKSLALENK